MRDTVRGETPKMPHNSVRDTREMCPTLALVASVSASRTLALMPLMLPQESKAELEVSRDSARRALRGLRAQMKEQATTVRNGALTVGGAFGAGYARAQFAEGDYEIFGYDASLVVGAAAVALGLYQGGDTGEMAMHAGLGMLSEYAAREGVVVGQQKAPATSGVSQVDYIRSYAGQQP